MGGAEVRRRGIWGGRQGGVVDGSSWLFLGFGDVYLFRMHAEVIKEVRA